tara:strand:+ start:2512 stop:2784 length:273 start_codon:yes stop_codon:yes gene_type:complete
MDRERGDSVEARHAATEATLSAHIQQCEERTKLAADQVERQRSWMQGHELRITDLEGKGKIMETKIAVFAAVAALIGSTFGPKIAALFGG